MRDLETITTALTAAETGHLVLATLHTPDTTQTVDRIMGVFPAAPAGAGARCQFANSLQAAMAQKLLPMASGKGRALACEILVASMAVRSIITRGAYTNCIRSSRPADASGMQTMDAALLDLYLKGEITYDAALSNATHPEFFEKRAAAAPPTQGNGAPEHRNAF